jgi:predicted nuclease of predicted toxin-antitoxin system
VAGTWRATTDRILVDADAPHEVVDWLQQHGIEGAAVFRVPVDPTVDSGSHSD